MRAEERVASFDMVAAVANLTNPRSERPLGRITE
jgi:hypothetical protein